MANTITADYVGTRTISLREFPATLVRVIVKPEEKFNFDIPYKKVVEYFSEDLTKVEDIYRKFHKSIISEYTVVRKVDEVYLEVYYKFPYNGGEKKALQFIQALSEL